MYDQIKTLNILKRGMSVHKVTFISRGKLLSLSANSRCFQSTQLYEITLIQVGIVTVPLLRHFRCLFLLFLTATFDLRTFFYTLPPFRTTQFIHTFFVSNKINSQTLKYHFALRDSGSTRLKITLRSTSAKNPFLKVYGVIREDIPFMKQFGKNLKHWRVIRVLPLII